MNDSFFTENIWLLAFFALLLDSLCGDFAYLNRICKHPVEWIGSLAIWLERVCNHGHTQNRFWIGFAVTCLLVSLSGLAGFSVLFITAWLDAMLGLQGIFLALVTLFFLAWLLAARTLFEHVRDIFQASPYRLAQARKKLAAIVGRKTDDLDENAISRAAIESLSENLSDGVIAPLFYFLLLGLPGLFAYKCLNTLDSLYGYRTERYHAFGKCAARLDDAANLIPARLTALLIIIAGSLRNPRALILNLKQLWQQLPSFTHYYRTRRHLSPNASLPETAFALLLAIRLGGMRRYRDGISVNHEIGTGRKNVTWQDIAESLQLYRRIIMMLGWGLAIGACVKFVIAYGFYTIG